MRKRFEQQLTIGRRPIEETIISISKRNGPLPALCAALKGTENTHTWQVRGYYRTKTWFRDVFQTKTKDLMR